MEKSVENLLKHDTQLFFFSFNHSTAQFWLLVPMNQTWVVSHARPISYHWNQLTVVLYTIPIMPVMRAFVLRITTEWPPVAMKKNVTLLSPGDSVLSMWALALIRQLRCNTVLVCLCHLRVSLLQVDFFREKNTDRWWGWHHNSEDFPGTVKPGPQF